MITHLLPLRCQLKAVKSIREGGGGGTLKKSEEVFKAELYLWSCYPVPRFVTDFKQILSANIAEKYFINIYIYLISSLFLSLPAQLE